ncbi:MAG: hypothetical protein K2N30_01310 [Clostridia bacterium]|nr:hypothetical protein [Clostridia bacterium]
MSRKTGKKLAKSVIFAIVVAVISGVILITAVGLEAGFVAAERLECIRPSYAKEDITETLEKQNLTEEDYSFLYGQTGLTKIGIDRALTQGTAGKNKILKIQQDFFAEHTKTSQPFAPFVCTEYIEKNVESIYLEKGDILITSSTHISGVRIGHAGLVTDPKYNSVLQANAYGTVSRISSASEFTKRINFMVLRIKDSTADRETVSDIVDYSVENLLGVPYEGLAGLLTNKNAINKTQCAHIIWYAFMQFGIDLDGNGGLMVTPYDICNSEHVELVQVFGFDKDKLWK